MIESSQMDSLRLSRMSSSLLHTDYDNDDEDKMDVASLSPLPDEDNNNHTNGDDESELKPFQKLLKQNNLLGM